MSSATLTTYGCTSCGRTTAAPKDWVMRGPEVVAQGVHLGTCGPCFANGKVKTTRCNGKCDGKYHSSAGTYYIAEQRDTAWRRPWEHGWSCWDLDCVEGYDPDELDGGCDCPNCDGQHHDVRVVTVVDGTRQGPKR